MKPGTTHRPIDPSAIDAAAFWKRIRRGAPDACWPWIGPTEGRGYGRAHFCGRLILAHRVAWALEHGRDLGNLDALHRCDNPPCCNPRHLFLGTHLDNNRDKVAKGRQPKGAEVGRKIRGERHGQHKLTEDLVRSIRVRVRSGERQASIARELGLSQMAVSDAVRLRTWGHVQ